MAYRSIYTQVYYDDWLMAYNPLCLSLTIPSTPSRCYPSPCFPTLLSYLSTLHYSLHLFHTSYSYTQSPISPSALFCTLATPLLWMPHKCWYLYTIIKLKKRGLSPITSFLCPKTYITGLVILCIGSLWLASLLRSVIAYRSIYTQVHYDNQPTAHNPLCLSSTIPFAPSHHYFIPYSPTCQLYTTLCILFVLLTIILNLSQVS